ncbi:MAG: class I SAM-dependent methyltransferase [Oligoflexia bacterium]|nr:class I SAM-dependent methyltransferase [Oligoflexia bacterium]
MSNQAFSEELSAGWPDLEPAVHERVLKFYSLVVDENSRQNLTRLISPKDFFEGHVLDVKELLKSGLVQFPAMDLGSGGGVPGLLAAVVHPGDWVLSESEGMKANFLSRAVQELGLGDRVRVSNARGEKFLITSAVKSVVARAVGPVDRIYAWLRPCSTWNNLVLLKGPAWKAEWERFQAGKLGKELSIGAKFEYRVGAEKKERLIVRLDRAARKPR